MAMSERIRERLFGSVKSKAKLGASMNANGSAMPR